MRQLLNVFSNVLTTSLKISLHTRHMEAQNVHIVSSVQVLSTMATAWAPPTLLAALIRGPSQPAGPLLVL